MQNHEKGRLLVGLGRLIRVRGEPHFLIVEIRRKDAIFTWVRFVPINEMAKKLFIFRVFCIKIKDRFPPSSPWKFYCNKISYRKHLKMGKSFSEEIL